MNAPDMALFKKKPDPLDDRPVDMIWILRGGATDVYTQISNLAALQRRLPNHHLSEISPYIMADSAGAYPGSSLAVANPIDPLILPKRFKENIRHYLSRDRNEAEAALIEDIGTAKVRDTVLPISISSVEITQGIKSEYFTNYPQSYSDARPGFTAPSNRNDDVPLAKAVLASSAFAFKLGEYKIANRRFMDLGFLETHPADLVEYYKAHQDTSDRRVVCVIFGNNYIDLQLGQNERLGIKNLKGHFADVMRARVQDDLVNLASALFGAENVIDLSLYIKQPFLSRSLGPQSDAFRSDALAIRERANWTDSQLKTNLAHQATLDNLAEVIKRGCLPRASIAASFSHLAKPESEEPVLLLSTKEKIISNVLNVVPTAKIAASIIAETLEPLVKTGRSAASWLQGQWKKADQGSQPKPPAQPHPSEPRTQPGFENKLP